MTYGLHHVELWTTDLDDSGAAFDWLLTQLGWQADSSALFIENGEGFEVELVAS